MPARRSFRSRHWPTRRPMQPPTPYGCPEVIRSYMPALWLRPTVSVKASEPCRTFRSDPRRVRRLHGAGTRDRGCRWVRHEMTGLLGVETSFARRKLHLGYRRARLQRTVRSARREAKCSAMNTIMRARFRSAGESLVDCRDASGASVPEQGMWQGSTTGTFFHVIDGAAA